ncbi:MAG: hydrogenase formation protein HypD [Eubacteriales bacterium]|nr:hydrogenase formation protein HypD [Eubacteriales bacterium]
MIDIKKYVDYLRQYDGPCMNICEVCGSHTAAIAKNGIKSILSPKISLISGPGCPVCVTPSSYIDRLIDLSLKEGYTIVTFGDLMKVPGSKASISSSKWQGVKSVMVYSPLDVISLAVNNPEEKYVFAAIGFETTTPVYALLLQQLISQNICNVKLLTALKTMPPAIEKMCKSGSPIHGFIAPGHVSVITGSNIYQPISSKYNIPFGVAGFTGEDLIIAIYGIVKARGMGKVMNFYPRVVTEKGNIKAQEMMAKYFEICDACWRGLGNIPVSGLKLKEQYSFYDAGSYGLDEDIKINKMCSCDKVLTGFFKPKDCTLFGKACTPENPQGACMVSEEGSCHTAYVNGENI